MRASVVDRYARRILHLNVFRRFSSHTTGPFGSLGHIRRHLFDELGRRRLLMLTVSAILALIMAGPRLSLLAIIAAYLGTSLAAWRLFRQPYSQRLVFMLGTWSDPVYMAVLFLAAGPSPLARLAMYCFIFPLLTNTIPLLSTAICAVAALVACLGFLAAGSAAGLAPAWLGLGALMLALAGFGTSQLIRLQREAFQNTLHFHSHQKTRRDQLARSSREKADFLANMNHELRTPLNGIIGMTGLLMSSRLEGEQEEYARTIRSSAELLLALINDILDMSRAEAGKLQIESKPFELAPVIALVSDNLKAAARDKGITLNVVYATPVPRWIMGDATRINQILFNLVGNAIKFTNYGRVSITVSHLDGPEGKCLSLAIADTGVGIPHADLEAIFEKYRQSSFHLDHEHKLAGTGLGLAISRELVNHMRGTIHVSSEIGRGSVFTAVIPCPPVSELPDELLTCFPSSPQPGGKPPIPTGDLPRTKEGIVLLADDNPVNLNLLGRMTRNFGYQTREVRNGEEALNALKQMEAHGRIDLAIIDYQMPGLNGDQVVGRLREWEAMHHYPTLPIVILTGHLGIMLEPVFKAFPKVEIVEKPLRIHQLGELVDKYLDKSAAPT